MLELLAKLFVDLSLFVGFIRNGAYPPPLGSEREKELVHLFLTNKDQDARRLLIEHNLRLVVHIAKKFDNSNTDFEDLISVGTVGLIKGVDSFNQGKGVKIATYCAKCIENEILMHFRNMKKSNQDISLFDSIGQDKEGNEIALIDVIPAGGRSVEEEFTHRDLLAKLTNYLGVLNERELEVIEYRYGLKGKEEMTQKELAKMFNISRSYISRIEKRALVKLLYEYRKSNDL